MTLKQAQKLVCDYMHWSGSKQDKLTPQQMWKVYCLGDGFGKCSPARLKKINDGWDWSHVRDSSQAAYLEMAKKIQKFIG